RHRHRRWRQHVDVPERVDQSRDDQAAVHYQRDGARQRARDAGLGLVLSEVCLEQRHGRAYFFLLRLVLATGPLVVFALPSPALAPAWSSGVAADAPLSGLSAAASLPGAGAWSLGIGLPIACNVLFRHSVDLST